MKLGYIALAVAALVLTGCGAEPVITDSPAPSTSATATSLPAIVFPNSLSGSQTGLDCDEVGAGVLPAGSGYTVSNLLNGASATADAIQAANGVACGFTNASGHLIVVGIAQLDSTSNDAVEAYYKATAAPTTGYTGSTPPDGVAYFDTANGLGEANEFYTGFWFYAASKDFDKPADATSMINSLWEQFAPKA